MKKQVAVRFNHPTFSEETVEKLGIQNTIARIKKEAETFEIIIDALPDFEVFADKVFSETGKRPTWSAVFSVNIKEKIVS